MMFNNLAWHTFNESSMIVKNTPTFNNFTNQHLIKINTLRQSCRLFESSRRGNQSPGKIETIMLLRLNG